MIQKTLTNVNESKVFKNEYYKTTFVWSRFAGVNLKTLSLCAFGFLWHIFLHNTEKNLIMWVILVRYNYSDMCKTSAHIRKSEKSILCCLKFQGK